MSHVAGIRSGTYIWHPKHKVDIYYTKFRSNSGAHRVLSSLLHRVTFRNRRRKEGENQFPLEWIERGLKSNEMKENCGSIFLAFVFIARHSIGSELSSLCNVYCSRCRMDFEWFQCLSGHSRADTDQTWRDLFRTRRPDGRQRPGQVKY